jgi:hypothetical protein
MIRLEGQRLFIPDDRVLRFPCSRSAPTSRSPQLIAVDGWFTIRAILYFPVHGAGDWSVVALSAATRGANLSWPRANAAASDAGVPHRYSRQSEIASRNRAFCSSDPENRLSYPLLDNDLFRRHIEAAYRRPCSFSDSTVKSRKASEL